MRSLTNREKVFTAIMGLWLVVAWMPAFAGNPPAYAPPYTPNIQRVHELGPAPGGQTCEFCNAAGIDGGNMMFEVGVRYVVDVIDSSGSPVTFAENQIAVFATPPGITKAPGSYQWTAQAIPSCDAGCIASPTFDAGTGTWGYISCVAEAATTTAPAGPYLCIAPEQHANESWPQ